MVAGTNQKPQESRVARGRPSQEDRDFHHQVRKAWSWELWPHPVGAKLTHPPRSPRSVNLNQAQLSGKGQTTGWIPAQQLATNSVTSGPGGLVFLCLSLLFCKMGMTGTPTLEDSVSGPW